MGVRELVMLDSCCVVPEGFMVLSKAKVGGRQIDAVTLLCQCQCFIPVTQGLHILTAVIQHVDGSQSHCSMHMAQIIYALKWPGLIFL